MATVADDIRPKVQLIETDCEPLETPWHFAAIVLLIDSVHFHLLGRTNYFVGGNMFVYYSEEQARNRDYRGPDFFFVNGVSRTPLRKYWAVWQEDGRYPDVIIELLSPTTAHEDRTTKKALYERTFHTAEYYCYDPETRKLEGWRLGESQRYQSIPSDQHGRLKSDQLQLSLGAWKGNYQGHDSTWLRFYDNQGTIVPIRAEAAEAEAVQLK